MKKYIKEKTRKYLTELVDGYSQWKRKNVTLRGIKQFGETNKVNGTYGNGLYTVPLSNKSMAKQYGDVYFVVNAIPNNPKIVNSVNVAEMLIQDLITNFCEKHNERYNPLFFKERTSIEKELMNIGYDGLIIKGREMVNYKPENIKYFKTEHELQRYYETL